MNKRSFKTTAIAYLIVALVFSGVFLALGIDNYGKANVTPVDLYEMDASEIVPGTRVTGNLRYALDVYASYGDEVSNDKQYYIISAGYDDAYFMGIEVTKKNYRALDAQVDKTYEILEVGGEISDYADYEINGVVKEMSGEMLQFYKEYFTDTEWYTQEELDVAFNDTVLPYYIEYEVASFAEKGFSMLIISGFILFFGIILFAVAMLKHKKQTREENYLKGLASVQSAQSVAATNLGMNDENKPPMGFEE